MTPREAARRRRFRVWMSEYYAARQADLLALEAAIVDCGDAGPPRPLRGNVFRLRPGHWWWEVIDGTPKRENVVTVGFANTQAEALRLCLLALRIESGPRR